MLVTRVDELEQDNTRLRGDLELLRDSTHMQVLRDVLEKKADNGPSASLNSDFFSPIPVKSSTGTSRPPMSGSRPQRLFTPREIIHMMTHSESPLRTPVKRSVCRFVHSVFTHSLIVWCFVFQ